MYCTSGKRPSDIPANAQRTYRDKGWSGWGDWLGTGRVAPYLKKYKTFNIARKFVHGLALRNISEWRQYCKSGKKPEEIPITPEKTYKGKGWIGYGDWLGTGVIATNERTYRSFVNARTYVHALDLKSNDEWRQYCKLNKKPTDLPASPEKVYKSEWRGWPDFLGTAKGKPAKKRR